MKEFSIFSFPKLFNQNKKTTEMIKMEGSKTQIDTDYLRRKHANYTYGLWDVWSMSNRQIKLKFGKEISR